MQIDFPYDIDAKMRTATTGDDDHIRDMIEQLLFTTPGERVNRPDFGTGLLQLVFAPNSDELATATESIVQGALQQYLGDLIAVESVQAACEESTLRVTVVYRIKRDQQRRTAEFSREV